MLLFWPIGRLVLGLAIGFVIGRASRCAEGGGPSEAPSRRPAAKARTGRGATRPGAARGDDLTRIEGIGPKISGILRGAGITTFAQLAKTPVDELRSLLASAGSRYRMHDPATWPEQAALAAAGRTQELTELQRTLERGRR